jgi:hypothetical protein
MTFHQKVFILLILYIALVARVYHFSAYAFGFDQVQIIENAEHILQGNLTLIGPRTGPADMFTGPLIYYLTAPVMWLFGIWSVVIVPFLLAGVTGVSILFLNKRYLNIKTALIIFTVWALSPFLIQYDRTLWNPDLSLLAFSLVFFPLLNKKSDWQGLLFVLLGSFLSYQAHFSGFLIPMLVLVMVLKQRKPLTYFLSSCLGLGMSLMPTFLFDLRHNWLNARGLITFMLAKNGGTTNPIVNFMAEFFHNLYVSVESAGKIFVSNINSPIVLVVGGILIYLALLNQKKKRENYLSILWIVAVAAIFGFYHSSKPEYYYFIIFPPLFVLMAHALENLSTKYLYLLLGAGIIYSSWMTADQYAKDPGLSLGNDLKVKSIVEKINSDSEISQIVLDIDALNYESSGIKYILKTVPLKEKGGVVHITYPNKYNFAHLQKVEDIGIWLDPRFSDLNYLTENNYIISTSTNIRLLKNNYLAAENQGANHYEVFDQQQKQGDLYTIPVKNNEKINWVNNCLAAESAEWNILENNEAIKYFNHYCFRYVPVVEKNESIIEKIIVE